MANYKLKHIKNTDRNNINTPQYSLIYSQKKGSDIKTSYEIISLLKENNDIIVEVDTSLIIQSKRNKFNYEDFISDIKKMNLQYSYKKTQYQRQDILSALFGFKRTEDEHVVTIYVPDSVWKEEDFKKIIPDCGVRYYVMKGSDDARKVLDNINIMTDREKNSYFLYLIYDASEFCQMGISSNYYGYADIKRILEIS
ncbi:MAG: hypothetical protein GX022_08345 [Clostridiaceae bacterium]|nr:hypothetical protein [Clostridiaceae bacterium]